MQWLDFLQWPAMVVTILAAWFTASSLKWRRKLGFCCFLLSNALWIAWGWFAGAAALVILQLFLAFMNIRGAKNNQTTIG